jgi:hypothetical protein
MRSTAGPRRPHVPPQYTPAGGPSLYALIIENLSGREKTLLIGTCKSSTPFDLSYFTITVRQ